MTLIRRFFSGPSLMQAMLAAARHHSVDPEDLAYEVIDKKHGFLKTPRGVVIEVDPERPTGAPEPVAPPAAEIESAPAAPLDRLEALTDPVQSDSPAFAPVEPERPPTELAPPAPEGPATEVPSTEVPTPEMSTPEMPEPEMPALEPPAETPVNAPLPADSPASSTGGAEPPLAGAPAGEPANHGSVNPQLVDAEWSPPEPTAPDLPARETAPPAVPDFELSETAAPDPEPTDSKWWDAEPAAPGPGLTAEPVVEREAVDAPDALASPVEQSPVEAPPASPEAAAVGLDDDLRQAVAQAVDELVYLAGLRVQVASVVEVDDGLTVELEGPDSGRVAAHGGRALLAIQHLLPRLLFSKLGRALHCRLDCEGFHAERTARLERLAREAAERVRSGGRSWLLEPMAPDERRLVHLALADEPDVETESVGEGYLKRVRVAQI